MQLANASSLEQTASRELEHFDLRLAKTAVLSISRPRREFLICR
jgi:hypothetical protein